MIVAVHLTIGVVLIIVGAALIQLCAGKMTQHTGIEYTLRGHSNMVVVGAHGLYYELFT